MIRHPDRAPARASRSARTPKRTRQTRDRSLRSIAHCAPPRATARAATTNCAPRRWPNRCPVPADLRPPSVLWSAACADTRRHFEPARPTGSTRAALACPAFRLHRESRPANRRAPPARRTIRVRAAACSTNAKRRRRSTRSRRGRSRSLVRTSLRPPRSAAAHAGASRDTSPRSNAVRQSATMRTPASRFQ